MIRPDLPHATSTDVLVLHTLRCIGYASVARIANATGLPESDVESELIDLAAAGLVTHEAGGFGGWGLTEAGRSVAAERIATELETTGTEHIVAATCDRFLLLNPELLDLCTAWQLRTVNGVPIANDHTDPSYDARVVNRFLEFDGRAEAACAELSEAMARFRQYRVRLAEALARVTAGELDYVTDSTASYHTVWCQLHEDLLATLGIPRR